MVFAGAHQTKLPVRPDRLTELDTLRGLAAIVVVNGHFSGLFAPGLLKTIRATLALGLFNGGPAVTLFFVLSGFVLTLKIIRGRRAGVIVVPLLRRWPRLAGPVAASSLLYIFADRSGAFPKPAWFASVVGQKFPVSVMWGRQMGDNQIWSVLKEAAFGTFVYGSAQHNPVLWTMTWELLGSLVAFGLACIVVLPVRSWWRYLLFVSLAVFASWDSTFLLGFPIGVGAAWFHVRFGEGLRMRREVALFIWLVAIALASWDIGESVSIWRWAIRIPFMARLYLWTAVECLAAVSVIATCLYCTSLKTLFRRPAGVFIGRLSFPLYLTHLLTMLSCGAWFCFLVFPNGINPGGLPLLYCAMIAAAVVVAMPIMAFDRWWIKQLSLPFTYRAMPANGKA